MSAATETRIFGIPLKIDPKFIVLGLIVFAGVLFWFNSRGDEGTPSAAPAASHVDVGASPTASAQARARATRRSRAAAANDRGTLRIRPIDATRGEVDPTLRLDLLSRLQSVEPAKPGRSLFEIGPAPMTQAQAAANMSPVPEGPKIPVVSAPPMNSNAQIGPLVNIPLKFYGFVKPSVKGETNRGLFLEGDNILIASEGELLDHRYLVVEVSATSARLEDTQIKQGQTIPVVPEATQQ